MQILHTAYDANKLAALAGLEEYYAQALGDTEENPNDTVDPYQATKGRISLEAQTPQGTVGRLIGAYDALTNSIRIELLFVAEAQRGQNIGGLLIRTMEQEARSKAVQMIFVDTTAASAPEFYRKQGFDVISEIQRYPVEHDTYILMMKRL